MHKNVSQNRPPSHNKILHKLGIEGNFLNLIRSIYKIPTGDIIRSGLSGERLDTFDLKSGTREGNLLSLLLFNIVLEVLSSEIREGKKSRLENK